MTKPRQKPSTLFIGYRSVPEHRHPIGADNIANLQNTIGKLQDSRRIPTVTVPLPEHCSAADDDSDGSSSWLTRCGDTGNTKVQRRCEQDHDRADG